MGRGRLHLSVDSDLAKAAKIKAERYNTSISAEVKTFLENEFLGDGVDPEEELDEVEL